MTAYENHSHLRMIVCVCRAVNDEAIRKAASEGMSSFDMVKERLGVGNQCGRCCDSAREVFASHAHAQKFACGQGR